MFVPITLDDSKREENFVYLIIHASFKERLLDLFSSANKSFKLIINYCIAEDQKYSIFFVTPLPQLGDKEDFNPKKKFTKVYMPEDMNNGRELRRLFQNKFHLNSDVKPEDAVVLREML